MYNPFFLKVKPYRSPFNFLLHHLCSGLLCLLFYKVFFLVELENILGGTLLKF